MLHNTESGTSCHAGIKQRKDLTTDGAMPLASADFSLTLRQSTSRAMKKKPDTVETADDDAGCVRDGTTNAAQRGEAQNAAGRRPVTAGPLQRRNFNQLRSLPARGRLITPSRGRHYAGRSVPAAFAENTACFTTLPAGRSPSSGGLQPARQHATGQH